MLQIRQATLADLPYIYDICAQTALDGEDARAVMSDDNKVGHYFAAPYLHHDISSCFVLSKSGIPYGYILGSVNTQQYTRWLNGTWIEHIRPLYPQKEQNVSGFDAFLNSVIHTPADVDSRLDGYDAHFHIDLLKDYQGQGWGPKLIQAFLDHCKQKSVKKLFLMVSSTHLKALGFYRHIGFTTIFTVEGAVAIGIDIS